VVLQSYRIQGMDCPDEETALRSVLASRPGLMELQFDLVRSRLTVLYDPEQISDADIKEAVASVGLRALEWSDKPPLAALQDLPRLISVIASGLFLIAGGMLHLAPGFYVPSFALFCAAAVSAGWFVARKGLLALKHLSLDMNFLMTIAAAGAIAIKEPFEAAAAMFLFSVAGLLESWSIDRARRAIGGLLDFASPRARVKRDDGAEKEIPPEQVVVGAHVVVRPGERVPLDGLIVEGRSDVNQAPITGESMPVLKTSGDEVFAGSINGSGAIIVKTTRRAEDTTLARIIHMVEQAQARKAPSQQWIERFAAVYTPVVCAVAAAAALLPWLFLHHEFRPGLYRALTLLVIACPCALVISTPVAIVCGLARAARDGILIKGGVHLERLSHVRCIAFDKTGTLTVGQPRTSRIVALNQHSEEEVLLRAAAIESRSEHPLAKAILFEAARRGLHFSPAVDFVNLEGRGAEATLQNARRFWIGSHRLLEEKGVETNEIHNGVQALERQGYTVVAVGSEHHACGYLGLADEPRASARDSVSRLRSLGVRKVVMLTGDNQATAEAVAKELAVDTVLAELLPDEKVKAVTSLKDEGCFVAMVGDGINDAPALAAADISIAMGGAGSHAAMETADVVLMADDLAKVPAAVELSRRAVKTLRLNTVLALATKAVFFGLAIAGRATLWSAVAADMGTSLAVIANSMRLLTSPRSSASRES